MTARSLRIAAPIEPPAKGRLWFDHEIPDQFLSGLPGVGDKVGWVRRHLPRATRIKLGQKSAWYQADVEAWLESLKGYASARRTG